MSWDESISQLTSELTSRLPLNSDRRLAIDIRTFTVQPTDAGCPLVQSIQRALVASLARRLSNSSISVIDPNEIPHIGSYHAPDLAVTGAITIFRNAFRISAEVVQVTEQTGTVVSTGATFFGRRALEIAERMCSENDGASPNENEEICGSHAHSQANQCVCDEGTIGQQRPNYCCWPGQYLSPTNSVCIGTPRCPDGRSRQGDDCVSNISAEFLPSEEFYGYELSLLTYSLPRPANAIHLNWAGFAMRKAFFEMNLGFGIDWGSDLTGGTWTSSSFGGELGAVLFAFPSLRHSSFSVFNISTGVGGIVRPWVDSTDPGIKNYCIYAYAANTIFLSPYFGLRFEFSYPISQNEGGGAQLGGGIVVGWSSAGQ